MAGDYTSSHTPLVLRAIGQSFSESSPWCNPARSAEAAVGCGAVSPLMGAVPLECGNTVRQRESPPSLHKPLATSVRCTRLAQEVHPLFPIGLIFCRTDCFRTTRQPHRFHLQGRGICVRTLRRTILWEEDNGVNVMRLLFRGSETAIHPQPLGTSLPPRLNASTEPEHQATTATTRRTKTQDNVGF